VSHQLRAGACGKDSAVVVVIVVVFTKQNGKSSNANMCSESSCQHIYTYTVELSAIAESRLFQAVTAVTGTSLFELMSA
jgi:hypothetical protein